MGDETLASADQQTEADEQARILELAQLTDRCDAHGVRLLVLNQRIAKAQAAYDAASVDAARDFAHLRKRNIPQVSPDIGQGRAALISLINGPLMVEVDEVEVLLLYAVHSPSDLEDYVVERAFADKRVIDLIAEHYPDFVERRLKQETSDWVAKEVRRCGGFMPHPGTGDLVKVAEVSRLDPTGEFRLKPDSRAQQMITAAIDAGLITEDGEIVTQGSEAQ